jgi:hypothetical protein
MRRFSSWPTGSEAVGCGRSLCGTGFRCREWQERVNVAVLILNRSGLRVAELLRQIWICSPGLTILVVPVRSAVVFANKISPSTGVLDRKITVAVVVKSCPKDRNSFLILVLFWARWMQSTSLQPVCFGLIFLCLFLARQPPVGQGFLIREVSRSHTTAHRNR